MPSENSSPAGPRTIKASEFKAKCLQLMDEVAERGAEIVITKNGKPTARLVAFHERPQSLFGAGRDRMRIIGDIISPLDVEWEAQSDPDRAVSP